MAQGANNRLFYAEFRTVFLFSECILDFLSFLFEIWKMSVLATIASNKKDKTSKIHTEKRKTVLNSA